MRYVITIATFVSSLTFASGWNCQEAYTGFPRVKVINHTTNTRVPAVFVASYRNETVLTARNEEINRVNIPIGVRYFVNQGDISAKLFVRHREGAESPLRNGESVKGMFMIIFNGERSDYDMNCYRYLKND